MGRTWGGGRAAAGPAVVFVVAAFAVGRPPDPGSAAAQQRPRLHRARRRWALSASRAADVAQNRECQRQGQPQTQTPARTGRPIQGRGETPRRSCPAGAPQRLLVAPPPGTEQRSQLRPASAAVPSRCWYSAPNALGQACRRRCTRTRRQPAAFTANSCGGAYWQACRRGAAVVAQVGGGASAAEARAAASWPETRHKSLRSKRQALQI